MSTRSGTAVTTLVAECSVTRRRQERVLFAGLADDPRGRARDALVARFLPMAHQLARRYASLDDREDLEQVAAIGLLKAIDRFDPGRGAAFSTFAVPTIVGELKRHLRDRSWSVHVARGLQELAVRVERMSSDLVGELGRAPTLTELATRVGTPPAQVREALNAAAARRAVSLDQPRPDGDDPRGDVAVVDAGYAEIEDADQWRALMRTLSDRDRLIVELQLRDDRCQREIGELVGLSQIQVSRLFRRAIERLKCVGASTATVRAAHVRSDHGSLAVSHPRR